MFANFTAKRAEQDIEMWTVISLFTFITHKQIRQHNYNQAVKINLTVITFNSSHIVLETGVECDKHPFDNRPLLTPSGCVDIFHQFI